MQRMRIEACTRAEKARANDLRSRVGWPGEEQDLLLPASGHDEDEDPDGINLRLPSFSDSLSGALAGSAGVPSNPSHRARQNVALQSKLIVLTTKAKQLFLFGSPQGGAVRHRLTACDHAADRQPRPSSRSPAQPTRTLDPSRSGGDRRRTRSTV